MLLEKIVVQVTVIEGTGLAAKDRNIFGRKTTSDPFVEVWSLGLIRVGKTKTRKKTLEPKWNQTFVVEFRGKQCKNPFVELRIFDHDRLSAPDAMGTVTIKVPTERANSSEWYDIPPDSAKNASGKLKVHMDTTVVFSQNLVRGNQFPLTDVEHIQVGLAWDMLPGNKGVDLDASCIAMSKEGQVVLADTVYYGNVANSNESVLHSGDEQEGDEEGDDESISFDMERIPDHVLCMYIILTVATPGMRIPDIQSTTMSIYDTKKRYTVCRFTPAKQALSQNATAMFMVRIGRTKLDSKKWIVSTIEDAHPTARDFGSLIPYLKSYTRDLLPSISVDPTERLAILRKGGSVRLSDYITGGRLPNKVTFGLAWDITDGTKIDLDASAICLDKDLNLIDTISYKKLTSDDNAIRHQGDERGGDALGDDEKIDLFLSSVNADVEIIGFVINSYSGQELDDVDRASCHLFDPDTGMDMISYALTNSQSLDGHTALIVGCLFRGSTPGEWCIRIISEAAIGKVAKQNVGDLTEYLKKHPLESPTLEDDEEIVVDSEMPIVIPIADVSMPHDGDEEIVVAAVAT